MYAWHHSLAMPTQTGFAGGKSLDARRMRPVHR